MTFHYRRAPEHFRSFERQDEEPYSDYPEWPIEEDEIIIDADASGLVSELPVDDETEPITTQALVIYQGETQSSDDTPLPVKKLRQGWKWRWVIVSAMLIGFASWFLLQIAVPWLFFPTAVVTIQPETKRVLKTFSVPFNQVGGRQLSPLTESETQTVPTTGTGHQDAVKAHGIVTLLSINSTTVQTGSFIQSQSGIGFTTDYTVTIPSGGSANVSVHAENPGPSGNIGAGEIAGSCCAANVLAENYSAFTGGADASTYQVVAQSDIQNVAGSMEDTLVSKANNAFQQHVSSSEQVVGSPVCTPTVQSDKQPGEKATQVTVTVREVCSGVVENEAQMQAYAVKALEQSSGGFSLASSSIGVTTKVTGRETFQVNVSGIAYYQWTAQQLQEFARNLVNQSVNVGIAKLSGQPGVYSAAYSIWGREQSTFPSDSQRIQVVVQSLIAVG